MQGSDAARKSLVIALNAAREDVVSKDELREAVMADSNGSSERDRKYRNVAILVKGLSDFEPFFKYHGSWLSLGWAHKSISMHFFAATLLNNMLSGNDAEASIEFLQQILIKDCLMAGWYSAIWGIEVDMPVEIDYQDKKLKLIPFDLLSDSAQGKLTPPRDVLWHLPSVTKTPLGQMPTAAIALSYVVSPLVRSTDPDLVTQVTIDAKESFEIMNDVISVISLLGPSCPIAVKQWFEYDDRVIEHVFNFQGTSGFLPHLYVMPLSHSPKKIEITEAQTLITTFLKITDRAFRARLILSLNRFNQALRLGVNGGVVDLAIALEALLGDSDNTGEIAHKISTRAALLASETLPERQRVFKQVKSLYTKRSKVVHGTRTSDKSSKIELNQIQEEFDRDKILVQLVIRKILDFGKIPDWSTLELSDSLI